MADAATKYIEGVCSGVEQKPGSDWVSFAILIPGRQRPVKLDTKLPEVINKAKVVGANHATWKFNEVDSGNPNPHRPGTNFLNRYLEDVRQGSHTPAGYVDQAASSGGGSTGAGTAPAPQPQMTKEEWNARDSASHRRACIAIAVSALEKTMPQDPSHEDLVKFNERVLKLSRWWHNIVVAERDHPGGEDIPSSGVGEQVEDDWAGTAAADPDAGRPPLSPHDDDIPF